VAIAVVVVALVTAAVSAVLVPAAAVAEPLISLI
jgi:hypothetical protein